MNGAGFWGRALPRALDSGITVGCCGNSSILGGWASNITVRHDDEGWEHYADRWEVVAPDGTVLASRTLYHPHVDEQPFTRSLNGLVIPKGIMRVRVRALRQGSRVGWH